jgi:hypothetical protein
MAESRLQIAVDPGIPLYAQKCCKHATTKLTNGVIHSWFYRGGILRHNCLIGTKV